MAAAIPEKELRRETTTGMSAPPTGRAKVTPRTKEASTATASSWQSSVKEPIGTANSASAPTVSTVTNKTRLMA